MRRMSRKDLALSLYAAGRSVNEIAAALECSEEYVANVVGEPYGSNLPQLAAIEERRHTASMATPEPGALAAPKADHLALMAEVAVCGVMWRDAKVRAAAALIRYKEADAAWTRCAPNVPSDIQQAFEKADDAQHETEEYIGICEGAFWKAVDAFATAQIQAADRLPREG